MQLQRAHFAIIAPGTLSINCWVTAQNGVMSKCFNNLTVNGLGARGRVKIHGTIKLFARRGGQAATQCWISTAAHLELEPLDLLVLFYYLP